MKTTLIILSFLLTSMLSNQVMAKFVYTKQSFWGKGNDYALQGYDATAYFLNNKPKKGQKEHSATYRNETWLFASAENKALFETDPQKYAPQYGGNCAWREAQDGEEVYGDPTIWTVVAGKLYLNYNKEVNDRWVKDIPGFIKKADNYWLKEFDALN